MSAKPPAPSVTLDSIDAPNAATFDSLATRARVTKALADTFNAEYTVLKDEMESLAAQLGIDATVTAPTWTFTRTAGRETLDKAALLTVPCACGCDKPALTVKTLKSAMVSGKPGWTLKGKDEKEDTK